MKIKIEEIFAAEIAQQDSLQVKVSAGAGRNKILEKLATGEWKIAVKAQREKNLANRQLLKFLKKKFGQEFSIASGHTSCRKVLHKIRLCQF